jgi:hypothetical protein
MAPGSAGGRPFAAGDKISIIFSAKTKYFFRHKKTDFDMRIMINYE